MSRAQSSSLCWVTAAFAAVFGGACGGDSLEPSDIPVATVEVAPPVATVVLGTTATFTASALDAAGNRLAARKVVWTSADSNFATVAPNGVVTGRYVGTVPIAATIEGKAAVAEVRVIPVPVVSVRVAPSSRDLTVGESAQLAAEPLDARGSVLSGRSIAWSSSRPNVATVTTSGVVAAISPGSAVITASTEGKSGVAAVTVSPAPVASVAVSPSSATLIVGQTLDLEAQPRDGSGHPLSDRTVTWSSNRTDVATVSSSGVVAAVSPGTATITATSEGRGGTATIVVDAPAVNRVEITPATATVSTGGAFRLAAAVYDSRGNVIPGAPVAWTSSDTRVATVDNAGRVVGVQAGSVVITATSGDKAGTAAVRVER